jgi:O-antigen/teichoic acid export membrane protein
MESIQASVKLSEKRIWLVCILSSGFYLFYWFYLTWKQLRDITGEHHYPVWHALALGVPIYGWFVVHRHLRTIKELQDKADIKTTLNIQTLVTLFVIANILAYWVANLEIVAVALVLDIISVVLFAFVLARSQNNLNSYWEHIKGRQLAEARIGIGEIVLVLLGLGYWALYLL